MHHINISMLLIQRLEQGHVLGGCPFVTASAWGATIILKDGQGRIVLSAQMGQSVKV